MILDILPRSLFIAVGVQLCCQFIKFVSHSIRLGRPRWSSLVTFGGMPSAHSAFVTALTVCIGVFHGFASDLFALSAVFGGIVIFDAYKLRGNVQKQASLLNRIQALSLPEDQRLVISEMVGHTVGEIAVGIVLAVAVALPLALWLR
jgi:acid phosphatase family membrane protein YuiD